MKHLATLVPGLLVAGLLPLAALAQTGGVAIGATAADVSAALDIVSSSKGVLLPRVADATALASPATGLIVYQTGGTPGYYYNAGTAAAPSWQQLSTVAGATITASNGLTKTGADVALGGTLTGATTIANAGKDFTISGTGNVGIGAASTGFKLQVAGSFRSTLSAGQFSLYNNLGTGNTVLLGAFDGTGGNGALLRFSGSSLSGYVDVGQGSTGGYAVQNGNGTLLHILPTGNVGLGTAAPAARLDIIGGADSNGANDPQALAFSWRNGGFRHFVRSRHNGAVTGGGNDLDFYLNSSTTASGSTAPGTGNVQVLTLESNNGAPRVGIGTTAPAYALDVVGVANAGTGLRVAGYATAYYYGSNLYLGTSSLPATAPTGTDNTWVGANAGLSLTTGINNTALGYLAGDALTTGGNNVLMGIQAGGNTTTGSDNVFLGHDPGITNISGSSNIAIGHNALYNNTASNNTAVGDQAGLSATTGSGLTAVGVSAGFTNTTGTNNTLLGAGADVTVNNLSNATALGAGAQVSQSNSLVLGNGANVGIGNSAPTYRLDVSGNLRSAMTNGTFRTHDFGPATGISTVLLSTWEGTNNNGPQVRFLGASPSTNYIDIGQNSTGAFVVEGNDVARLTVQNAGTVGIGSLGGTGTRVVTADASGNLATSATATTALESLLRMQKGTVTVGAGGANATVQVTITFPTAFATVPTVTVTPRNQDGTSYDDTFAATIRSISTTQCVVNVRRADSSGLWTQSLQLNWLAIP